MSNMSYCRFENTVADLLDCRDAMEIPYLMKELSDSERKSMYELINLCSEIAEEYGDMEEDEDE